MSTALRAAIAGSLVAAVVEAVLLEWLAPEGRRFSVLDPAIYLFVTGPMLFFALLLWRRRKAIPRPRLMLVFALGLAAVAIVPMVNEIVLRARSADPHIHKTPSSVPLLVPFAQWVPLLAGWLVLVIQERRARRSHVGETPGIN